MKKLLIVILLVFAANIIKAQTSTKPKIHLWVKEGETDYTISNELWTKLGDSRIFNKLGTYGYCYKWDNIKEYDYVLLINLIILNGGNTVTIDLLQTRIIEDSKELLFKSTFAYTNISDQSFSESVESCYKQTLIWHDDYMK
ncbi:MAG: hypothetical protein CVV25_03995 [Ignavibacteriae bacterium HGW-Ignavibacteriae-4]|jgi:hypothetical protein|nr:MAG: hypothetical protein CVV25_03995 [Ignavibacteriae bacterium HGW-Ignavibacteriae-4]